MHVTEIAFSVYPVTDLKRARAFYEGTLGLKPGMVYEGEGVGWIEYEIGPGVVAIGAGSENFKPSSNGGSLCFAIGEFSSAVPGTKNPRPNVFIEPLGFPLGPVCAALGSSSETRNSHPP